MDNPPRIVSVERRAAADGSGENAYTVEIDWGDIDPRGPDADHVLYYVSADDALAAYRSTNGIIEEGVKLWGKKKANIRVVM